jgi:hypothetical protein
LTESEKATLAEIKAVLRRMKQAELDWEKEQSEKEKTLHSQTPQPTKEND